MKDGNLKLGGEAEMFGIAPNRGKNYNMSMIASSATHKKGSSHLDIGKILSAILRVYDTSGANKRGPITGLWGDGAAINNLACFQMCTEFEIDKGSLFGLFCMGQMAADPCYCLISADGLPRYPSFMDLTTNTFVNDSV